MAWATLSANSTLKLLIIIMNRPKINTYSALVLMVDMFLSLLKKKKVDYGYFYKFRIDFNLPIPLY